MVLTQLSSIWRNSKNTVLSGWKAQSTPCKCLVIFSECCYLFICLYTCARAHARFTEPEREGGGEGGRVREKERTCARARARVPARMICNHLPNAYQELKHLNVSSFLECRPSTGDLQSPRSILCLCKKWGEQNNKKPTIKQTNSNQPTKQTYQNKK